MSEDNRPNREIVEEFRTLLTAGFYVVTPFGEIMSDKLKADHLTATKPWRNEVWRAFKEIDRRLCPKPTNKQRDLFNDE